MKQLCKRMLCLNLILILLLSALGGAAGAADPAGGTVTLQALGSGALGGEESRELPVAEFPAEITLPTMADTKEEALAAWTTVDRSLPWNAGEGEAYRPGDTITVTESTTLYAWVLDLDKLLVRERSLAAIYDARQGRCPDGKEISCGVVSNKDLVLYDEGAVTRKGYTLTGWNTAPDGSGSAYAPGAVLPEAEYVGKLLRLYARWEPRKPGYLDFDLEPAAETTRMYVVLYDPAGKFLEMIAVDSPQLQLTEAQYAAMGRAKLLQLGETGWTPTAPAGTLEKREK